MNDESDDVAAAAMVTELTGNEQPGLENEGEVGADTVFDVNMEINRDYVELPANLAKDKKLAGKALEKVIEHFDRFLTQPARIRLLELMTTADAMARVSKRRKVTTATDNQLDTLSNVASTSFYDSLRVITAGQNGMIFYGTEMPVKYEPRLRSQDFENDNEAERVCKEQNALLLYTRDEGRWDETDKLSNYFGNKYGQEIQSITWDYRTRENAERIPTGFDANGKTTSFKWEKKQRVVADFPIVERVGLDSIWFDMQIDSDPAPGLNAMQKQHCIIRQVPNKLEYFRQKEIDGEYLNTEKIGDAQKMGPGSNNGEEVKEERQDNAAEETDTRETGDIDGFYVWVRLPIEKKNGKYTWNAKITPHWFECVWSGKLKGGDVICHQLRENPYAHGENPYNLEHSHIDDKGAIHMGYASIGECLYEVDKTAIDEMIDNKTLRTKAPLILEQGNVIGKNFKFRGSNQGFWCKAGTGATAYRMLNIPDTTMTTLPFIAEIQRRWNKTMGTDSTIAGGDIRGRASATQAQNTLEQAMKPAIEDAKYRAAQRYHWQARIVAALWRQFGDPERIIAVTYENQILEINPTTLYGDFKTRIVSVGQFEADLAQQQTQNDFIARVIANPNVAALMGQKGLREFFIDTFKSRKMQNVEKYFQATKTKDAARIAWYEGVAILQQGDQDIPEQGEDHAEHLRVHEPYYERWKMVMSDTGDPIWARNMELHILVHKQLQAQEQVPQTVAGGSSTGEQGPNQYGVGAEAQPSAAPPMLPGEAVGDMMGAVSQGGEV